MFATLVLPVSQSQIEAAELQLDDGKSCRVAVNCNDQTNLDVLYDAKLYYICILIT
jgi:hypothetical protein